MSSVLECEEISLEDQEAREEQEQWDRDMEEIERQGEAFNSVKDVLFWVLDDTDQDPDFNQTLKGNDRNKIHRDSKIGYIVDKYRELHKWWHQDGARWWSEGHLKYQNPPLLKFIESVLWYFDDDDMEERGNLPYRCVKLLEKRVSCNQDRNRKGEVYRHPLFQVMAGQGYSEEINLALNDVFDNISLDD